ncbi:S-layer family protein [Lentilactobacillus parabuchneri]|uniref:S-layer family protein n=1 Tax=Lentilactobacillus parabuchneri TaxID=152331 RepID=UPI000A11ECA9|nr:S-layer family protein [Lentilactobacillus parabuchneri]ORN10789.1 S-layer protein precursor [Lentilactobacillus parabuchneri]ORN23593.1 S-layer protein precursor [Lentilactobacillus parabuchneri]
MTSNLKKSLFVSLVALGFVAAAGTATAQSANAKSYARVTSNHKMTSTPTSRNVNFTGSNALYTKAGTLRGAKKVASTTTVKKIANSKSSQNNVRAYRVATTNRGSVYYKVVTYDGAYRGWIYGGKVQSVFGGGITAFDTFKNQNLSSLTDAQQKATYKIASPGTANDGKTVTYKQPAWTQYKVGRAITDSSPYANSTFKIDQVGTRTREGDQWVHITDTTNANSPANGWILYSGLKQTEAPVADNAIQINLVDPKDNSKVIKSITVTRDGAKKGTNFGYSDNGNWTISMSDRASILNQIRDALNGTSYTLDMLTTAQIAQIAQTNFGSSVNISVNAVTNIADNALRINFRKPDGTSLKTIDFVKGGATKETTVGSAVSGSTNWTLSDGDKATIQSQITTALANSGYQLSGGNTLSTSQIDTIARGQYGGQVYLNVVPVSNGISTITPYGKQKDSDDKTLTALKGVSGVYSNTPNGYSIPSEVTQDKFVENPTVTGAATPTNRTFNVTAAQLADPNGKDLLTNFLSGIKDDAVRKAAYDGISEKFVDQAKSQFISTGLNFDEFSGTPGAAFTEDTATGYVNNSALKTLKSVKIPVFSPDGDIEKAPVKDTNEWVQYTFSAYKADSGTYGNPVKAYYTYDGLSK